MTEDRARILELLAECRVDLAALERSTAEVATLQMQAPAPADGSAALILYGYHLHQWYCAAENLLLRIAAYFGNQVDPNEWHRGLLERMKLEIPGLRPAVLSEASFEHLNAVRGFRHVFRHAYDYTLKWDLMAPIVKRLPEAQRTVGADMARFMEFLQELAP